LSPPEAGRQDKTYLSLYLGFGISTPALGVAGWLSGRFPRTALDIFERTKDSLDEKLFLVNGSYPQKNIICKIF